MDMNGDQGRAILTSRDNAVEPILQTALKPPAPPWMVAGRSVWIGATGQLMGDSAIWQVFWPGLIGSLGFVLIAYGSPPSSEGPFQFLWLLCGLATCWVLGYVVWTLLEARQPD